MKRSERELLDAQIAYYRARAPEYDEWFFRLGRYDHGEAHKRAWFAELARVERALGEARPEGRVLELACGTGLWTRHLLRTAATVTAVDASPEVLEANRRRVASARVEYIRADLFDWEPRESFDFVFFGFWLSHVPPAHFEAFWSGVRRALRPDGRVFFVDNARNPSIAATNHALPPPDSFVMERRLNDGRRFRVVKVFYEPEALRVRLESLGWCGFVRCSGQFFVYGSLTARRVEGC